MPLCDICYIWRDKLGERNYLCSNAAPKPAALETTPNDAARRLRIDIHAAFFIVHTQGRKLFLHFFVDFSSFCYIISRCVGEKWRLVPPDPALKGCVCTSAAFFCAFYSYKKTVDRESVYLVYYLRALGWHSQRSMITSPTTLSEISRLKGFPLYENCSKHFCILSDDDRVLALD